MALAFRLVVVAAALLGAWGLGHLNGPVRLAGPFNLPDPLPAIAVAAAFAMAALGVPRAGWGQRPLGLILVAVAALVAAAGIVNRFGPSPDGGQWGDRYVPAAPEWSVALCAIAIAFGLAGAVLAQRAVR